MCTASPSVTHSLTHSHSLTDSQSLGQSFEWRCHSLIFSRPHDSEPSAEAEYGGWPMDMFADKPPEDLLCPICHQVLRACIRQLALSPADGKAKRMRPASSCPCPAEVEVAAESLQGSRNMRRKVSSLLVKCPNRCGHTKISLATLPRHIETECRLRPAQKGTTRGRTMHAGMHQRGEQVDCYQRSSI
jgi:hypothetical protein